MKPAIFKITSGNHQDVSSKQKSKEIPKIDIDDDTIDIGCNNKQVVVGITVLGIIWVFSWISSMIV